MPPPTRAADERTRLRDGHQEHAPGRAALLAEEHGVLVAGDMLSDVLIPMLDFNDTADPIEDYLAALRLIEGAADEVNEDGATGRPDRDPLAAQDDPPNS